MSEPTKACNLTKAEIKVVMQFHGYSICDTTKENNSEAVERINYLNKRLLSFNEPENTNNAAQAPPAGWGT